MAHKKKVKQLKIEKPSRADFVFLMTAGVLFAWSLFIGIMNPTIFGINYLLSLVRIFAFVGVLGLIFSNKRAMWIGIGLFALFLIFVASGFLLAPEYPNMANRLAESLTNTIGFITGYRPHTDLYETIIVWTISLAIGLFVVIFSYYRFRFLLLFIGSTIIFGVAITSNYFSYTNAFYVFVFSSLVFLIRHLHQRNATEEVDPAPFTKYILALTIISLLVAGILPIPREGFAEGFAQNFVQRPFNFVNDLFVDLTQPNIFSLRQVGFGGSGRLGGDIALNDGLFMRMRITRRGDPIYLTGAIMDTYTGNSWVNRFNDENPVDFDDISQNLELLEYALWNELRWLLPLVEVPVDRFDLLDYDDEFFDEWRDGSDDWFMSSYLRVFRDEVTGGIIELWLDPSWEEWVHRWNISWVLDHVSLSSMRIDVLDLRPLSAFHTGLVQEISLLGADDDDVSFLRDRDDGRFFADRRMPHNTQYLVRFFEQNHQQGSWSITDDGYWEVEMRSRLTEVEPGWLSNISYFITEFREFHGYDVAMRRSIEHNGIIIYLEDLLNDYLIPRVNRIHEMYTTLPDDFPDRVRELAYTITEDATNDYERMRLLESYLNQNFAYTLTPGPSPQNRDFVDHFLFDIRQGYCVHFATAFVTMARSLGVPARYVEGFLVHNSWSVERNEGYIDVLNNMAHAWAEVHFEGSGWVRFEPTPASGLPQEPTEPEEGNGAGTGSSPSGPGYYEEFFPDHNGDLNIAPQLPENGAGQAEEDEVLSERVWILIGIGFVFALIATRIIFVHIKIKQTKYKVNNQAVIHLFGTVLSYFKVFKFRMKADETARQFAIRMCHEHFNDFYDERLQSLLKEAAEVFSKARYSNLAISNEERRIVEKLIKILDTRMKYTSKWKYFYDYYIQIRH